MKSAEKLLRRMRNNPNGWGQNDFARLYSGFGFRATEVAKHRIYIHEEYPELRATVARHNSLATGYAQHAVEVIDKLKILQAQKEGENNDPPPESE
jgi:hypothetical protein